MQDDPFPAAEKILTDIENIFKRDKALSNFEILPVAVGENKSPVLYAEHTLGLEEWCVRHLYLHIYRKLMTLKEQQKLRREDPNVVSRLLLGGVLLNPDCTLLWNMRRDFVVMGRFDSLSELHVNAIALSRRPKSSEAFVYRRWTLNRILAKAGQLDAATSSHLLEDELRVCLMAADCYANNYHAWNHRMWVMSHLTQAQDTLVDEWLSSEKWVSVHVSEHSGLHYREFLFQQMVQHLGHSDLCSKLHKSILEFFHPLKSSRFNIIACKDTSASRHLHSILLDILENKTYSSSCPIGCSLSPFVIQCGLLAYEFLLVTELIRLYPGHEALWCHRRFVVFSFNALGKKIFAHLTEEPDFSDGVPLPKSQKLSLSEFNVEDSFLWHVVLWHEDVLFKECSARDPEECYQSKLAHRYNKWFETTLLPKSRASSDSQGATCIK